MTTLRVSFLLLVLSSLAACGDDEGPGDDAGERDDGEVADADRDDGEAPDADVDADEPDADLPDAEVDAADDADEPDGEVPDADPIDAGRELGSPCDDANQCGSGFCVTSICCDSACEGACEGCAGETTGELDGTCAPIAASASVVCREAAGLCDLEEACDGTSTVCPVDRVVEAETVCRAVAGVCDRAEACSGGSADCPPDTFLDSETVCRAAAGTCDATERCSGSDPACPTDAYRPVTDNVCAPYACGGLTTCETTCSTHAQCSFGSFCVTGMCVPGKRMFVSSTVSSGNLGGVAGADVRCQTLATTAGLTGTYKAWISDSTSTAAARLVHYAGPYYRLGTPSNLIVAANWDDLVDGTTVAIATDENGTVRGNQNVWTGTSGAGALTTPTCLDWTSASLSVQGRAGYSSSATTLWTSNLQLDCYAPARLYCVEQ